jgi:hypothetical protein
VGEPRIEAVRRIAVEGRHRSEAEFHIAAEAARRIADGFHTEAAALRIGAEAVAGEAELSGEVVALHTAAVAHRRAGRVRQEATAVVAAA